MTFPFLLQISARKFRRTIGVARKAHKTGFSCRGRPDSQRNTAEICNSYQRAFPIYTIAHLTMLGHAAFLYTSMRTDGSQNIIRPYHGKGNMVRPLIKGVQQTVARYSGRDWHHGLRRKIFHAGVGRVVSSRVKMREAMIKVQVFEML